MRHYELITVLSPILNQEQSVEAWDRIKDFITNREAEIVREQNWGTRRLAYPIHKGAHHFLEGTYYLTHFSTEKPFNQELETFLRLDERVLRSLVIATGPPPPEPEPAPVVEPVAQDEEAAVESAENGLEQDGVETAVAVAEAVVEEAPAAEAEAVVEEAPAAEAEAVVEEAPAAEAEAVVEEPPTAAEAETQSSETGRRCFCGLLSVPFCRRKHWPEKLPTAPSKRAKPRVSGCGSITLWWRRRKPNGSSNLQSKRRSILPMPQPPKPERNPKRFWRMLTPKKSVSWITPRPTD